MWKIFSFISIFISEGKTRLLLCNVWSDWWTCCQWSTCAYASWINAGNSQISSTLLTLIFDLVSGPSMHSALHGVNGLAPVSAMFWIKVFNKKDTASTYQAEAQKVSIYRIEICYNGTSPLGHLYPRDISIQETQNLVPEKRSHNLCISYHYWWDTSIQGKGTHFLGPKTRVHPPFRGHLNIQKVTDHKKDSYS